MSQNHWERQRREIDSYNVFFSAYFGLKGGPKLQDLDFVQPWLFPSIPRRGEAKDAKPDIATYNGSTLLLAEIKSGKNLNPSHIEQAERVNSVTIEDARNYLRNAEVASYGLDHNDLTEIEPCFVYFEDAFTSHIRPNASGQLSKLENECPILTQSKGGELTSVRGSFNGSSLDSFMGNGVDLPKVPTRAVYLNEEMERECLAVSISRDHVLPELKHGRVELDPQEVANLYPDRAVDYRDAATVLRFLSEVGACRDTGDGSFEFERSHQVNLLEVTDVVSENRVDDYLSDVPDNQSSLEDW